MEPTSLRPEESTCSLWDINANADEIFHNDVVANYYGPYRGQEKIPGMPYRPMHGPLHVGSTAVLSKTVFFPLLIESGYPLDKQHGIGRFRDCLQDYNIWEEGLSQEEFTRRKANLICVEGASWLHDSGREDDGDDTYEDEHVANCLKFFMDYGVNPERAKFYAEAIRKERSLNKSTLAQTAVRFADMMEIIRARGRNPKYGEQPQDGNHSRFYNDPSRLPIYQLVVKNAEISRAKQENAARIISNLLPLYRAKQQNEKRIWLPTPFAGEEGDLIDKFFETYEIPDMDRMEYCRQEGYFAYLLGINDDRISEKDKNILRLEQNFRSPGYVYQPTGDIPLEERRALGERVPQALQKRLLDMDKYFNIDDIYQQELNPNLYSILEKRSADLYQQAHN